MAGCEKCWADAYRRTLDHPMKSQTEHYQDLLEERKDNPCTPEEQKYGKKRNSIIDKSISLGNKMADAFDEIID